MITITRIKYSNNINSVDKKKKKNLLQCKSSNCRWNTGLRPREGREPRSRAEAESQGRESQRTHTQKYLERILCPYYQMIT